MKPGPPSKLIPVYDKHKEIIIEMISKGINKKEIHKELNLPGCGEIFRIWCSSTGIYNCSNIGKMYDINKQSISLLFYKGVSKQRIHKDLNLPGGFVTFIRWCWNNNLISNPPNTVVYKNKKTIITHLLKTMSTYSVYTHLNLPGTSTGFKSWCVSNKLCNRKTDITYIEKYEKEIATLLITNSVPITASIVNYRFKTNIKFTNIYNYITKRYKHVKVLIEKYSSGNQKRRYSINYMEYPWDKILEEMKTSTISTISKKYCPNIKTYSALSNKFKGRFNCTLSQAFYNKFGYKYTRYGYMEQHTESIYILAKEGISIPDVVSRLNLLPRKLETYLQNIYSGKSKFIKYFDENPNKLQEIMNRYTTIEDDMLDFSEEAYLKQSFINDTCITKFTT